METNPLLLPYELYTELFTKNSVEVFKNHIFFL